MKNKIIYIFISLFIIVITILGLKVFLNKGDVQVKGQLEILVNSNEYDYLVKCANEFMELNDKTTITIKKADTTEEIESILASVPESKSKITSDSKSKTGNVGELNLSEISRIGIDKFNFNEDRNELLESYAKNFSNYRVEQIKFDGNAIGIPLTSRPLALFVRKDMLNEYGYDINDFNTWQDVLTIGNDIYTKSNGTVHIMNATGEDYTDLVDLLIMQNLKDDVEDSKLKEIVNNKIQELKDNNVLNLVDGGEFLARISSINAVREIIAIEEDCEWSAVTVPSAQSGSSKFYSSVGENLVILNENTENKNLVNKFLTYVITNTDDTMEYVLNAQFFSSYLYTYKSTEIENEFKNFVGISPLVVLSNIEEKTLPLQDYSKFIKVKTEFTN